MVQQLDMSLNNNYSSHPKGVEQERSIAGKKMSIKHIDGPLGVRGGNSDNRLIFEKPGWKPSRQLREGMEKTYRWIESQMEKTLVCSANI